jgi:hypothetical protein
MTPFSPIFNRQVVSFGEIKEGCFENDKNKMSPHFKHHDGVCRRLWG